MSLNNQINIYSVDTSSFYTRKENELHWLICKIRSEKKIVTKIIDELKCKLGALGIGDNEISNIKENNFDFSGYEEYEITLIIKLINDIEFYNTVKGLKTKLQNDTKDRLLKTMAHREELNCNKSTRYVRKLRPEHLRIENIISVFDSSLTRLLKLEKDKLYEDIIIVRVYYFDVLKDIMKNGFYSNGKKYVYFTSSAGQIRTKKAVFIREEAWINNEKTLMCGLTVKYINDKGGMNVNKFLAYLALSNSATDLWDDFDITKTIVVPDFETQVFGEFDFIDDSDYSITHKKGFVPITHTDGCGMILPELSNKNFMVRLPWIKGLLAVFDFRKFISVNKCSPVIQDIYGNKHDVIKEDIQIIFTESQFKMHKYYDSWDQYVEYFKLYKCTAGKCNEEEDRIPTAKINYQMIQTLVDMTDDELKRISKISNDKIKNISHSVKSMLEAFGIYDYRTKEKNPFQKALTMYPELLRDVFCKDTLKQIKASMVKRYRAAKLDVYGKFTFLVPDLYAFCERLFLKSETPNGLLHDNEVFCSLYPNAQKLDCLRSPHLYKEHAVRPNVVTEKNKEWFTTDAIYTSTFDLISKILQFDDHNVESYGNIRK